METIECGRVAPHRKEGQDMKNISRHSIPALRVVVIVTFVVFEEYNE